MTKLFQRQNDVLRGKVMSKLVETDDWLQATENSFSQRTESMRLNHPTRIVIYAYLDVYV